MAIKRQLSGSQLRRGLGMVHCTSSSTAWLICKAEFFVFFSGIVSSIAPKKSNDVTLVFFCHNACERQQIAIFRSFFPTLKNCICGLARKKNKKESGAHQAFMHATKAVRLRFL